MNVKYGEKVSIAYKGRYADSNEVFDVRDTSDPAEIVLGHAQIFPLIERELKTMEEGETRVVELPCRQAYGEFKPEAVRKFPLIAMPNWQDLSEGMLIEVNSDRAVTPARALVKSIQDEYITLDFNHPLAGRDLVYEVTLLKSA